jgi:tetratricopeptide (TPR) repeat protein
MSLTLAMIVKDEEAHLGHCLDSVRGLVDERIVVDTGSTDGTVALAEARGARILRFPWTGHFADARNAGIEAATGDWILVLDADEALDARDFPVLRAAMARADVSAYRLIVRNYVPDSTRSSMDQPLTPNPGGYDEGAGHALCGDARILRLFRRLPGAGFTGRIHELLDPFFEERGLAIEPLDAVVHHYGQTLADRVERKLSLYLDLARKDVRERPEVFQSHHNLVLQAASAQDWATVLEAAADLERRFPRRPTSTVLFAQAMALQNLGRHREALAAFDHLLQLSPGHALAEARRGVSLAALGRPEEARRVYRAALRKNPRFLLPYVLLAELDEGLGDAAQARAALLEGTRACPADPALWVRLLGLDMAAGATDLAVQDAWSAIQACPGGGAGHWHSLVGLALLRRGERQQGRAVLALGLQAFPGHPALTRLLERT